MDVRSLSTEELKQAYADIGNELKRRDQEGLGKVKVYWDGECDAKHSKKIYLAIITKNYGKGYREKYTFLQTTRHADPGGQYIKAHFEGHLSPGTILKARSYSFGSTERDNYYNVTENGLDVITQTEAFFALGIT